MNYAKIPKIEDIINLYYEAYSSSQKAHNEISDAIVESNIIYGEASVSEDIFLDKYTLMYNKLKMISDSKKSIIIDSFISSEIYDLDFPIENKLNLDKQNGKLTLPIISSNKLDIDSIVIGASSNGRPSENYNDISSILDSSKSTIFMYEKTVANNLDDLELEIMVKLKIKDISNGVLIKLVANNDNNYPIIENIEISEDGIIWNTAIIDNNLKKSDIYIKYNPQITSFLKIKFKQNVPERISNQFGDNYNFYIGIREISISQILYNDIGEYVSVPFVVSNKQNTFSFYHDSTGDIDYFYSLDNGIKWSQIDKEIINIGHRDSSNLRLKIKMDKSNFILDKKEAEETKLISSDNVYYLSNNPILLSTYIGSHISYGDMSPYKYSIFNSSIVNSSIKTAEICKFNNSNNTIVLENIPYYSSIQDDLIIKINNIEVKNNNTIYSINRHSNPNNIILNIISDELTSNGGQLSIYFKEIFFNNIEVKSDIINLPHSIFDNNYIILNKLDYTEEEASNITSSQYTDTNTPDNLFIYNDSFWESSTKVSIGGTDVWYIKFDTSDNFILDSYELEEHIHSTNIKKWDIEATNNQIDPDSWIIIHSNNSEWNNNIRFNIQNKCKFKTYRIKIYETSSNVTTCSLKSIKIFNMNSTQLRQFDILSSDKIKIKKDNYSIKSNYTISYQPAFEVQSSIIKDNKVSCSASYNSNSKLLFKYRYKTKLNNNIQKYFTPICNEYRLELKWI